MKPPTAGAVRWLPLVAAVLLAGAGCRGSYHLGQTAASQNVAAAQPVGRVDAAAPITLPDDDAPHDVLTEWWYYTGHLRTNARERFGFEFVIFQTIRGSNPVGYLSHFAITDEADRRFSYDSRAATRSKIPSSFDLDVSGWTLSGGGGNDRLAASMVDYGLELALSQQKPAALHGGGLISFGPAGDSYYFSRTRVAATGRLRRGDVWSEVTGQAWHDHQWGDFIVPAVGGWDWISLQLDGNRELMLTVLRAMDGTPARAFGSFIDASGETVDVPGGAISVQATGSWTSTRTGATYPSGWRATVNASTNLPAIALTLSPVLADQELAFEHTPYWEGAVDVVGTVDGRPSTGEGYVELTGYKP